MRPRTAGDLRDVLVTSENSIRALIDLLESMICVPQHETTYLRLSEEHSHLIARLGGPRQELGIVLDQMNGLDTKISNVTDASVRKALKQERTSLRTRAEHLQQELDDLVVQVKGTEKAQAEFVADHPSQVHNRVLQRLRREFMNWQRGVLDLDFGPHVRRIYWELLKPSGDSWSDILRHYEYLQRVSNCRYDLERLKKIHNERPDMIYIGLAAFEGYVVFVFSTVELAVLDCPQVGNAIYLMESSDWMWLSHLSKTELLSVHEQQVRRIVHGQQWLQQLRTVLWNRRRKDLRP
jgi:hypothetical protein